MNYVYLSPHFPPNYYLFCVHLSRLGVQVLGLKDEGMPILLSEQNSGFVLRLSDRAYILEKGEVRWGGKVETLQEQPDILKTYLGV